MRIQIVPSPCAEVLVTQYDEAANPKFRELFRKMAEDSPLRPMAFDPSEAATAIVIENRSAKEITALRYRWVNVDASGKSRAYPKSSDSYQSDGYNPVIAAGARRLVTWSGGIDEGLIDQMLAAGGHVGSIPMWTQRREAAVETAFAIDFILFADGENCGADPDGFGMELQCRKRAAEFVATQVRMAQAGGWDATPVVDALRDIPHLGNEVLARQVSEFARTYLQLASAWRVGLANGDEAALRHLENRPELPEFYRREPPRL